MTYLIDSHYHLDFLEDLSLRKTFIQSLADQDLQIVAQTIVPSAYDELINSLEVLNEREQTVVLPSLGFHPWWIESSDHATKELVIFKEKLNETRFIGEIGLDFSNKRLEKISKEIQIETLRSIFAILGDLLLNTNQQQPYVLSIHAVGSVSTVLDLLEESNLCHQQVITILHRFAGTSDELTRHIRMGGYLSVHPQMLKTKRGRAYVKQIPAERLLLESDWPEAGIADAKDDSSQLLGPKLAIDLKVNLEDSLRQITYLRQEEMLKTIQNNQNRLYKNKDNL